MNKKDARLRRAKKSRSKIKRLGSPRLCVHRTPRHIYAQLIMPGSEVVVSVSTQQSVIKSEVANTGNIDAAKAVGRLIAQKAKEAGVVKVAFDRSGFNYHGRVRALAEAAREQGLQF